MPVNKFGFFFLFLVGSLSAQETHIEDSTYLVLSDTAYQLSLKDEKIASYYTGVGLLSLGVFTHLNDDFLNKYELNSLTTNYFSKYKSKLDDFTQFVPLGLALSLDAVGIEGRHNYYRKLGTSATIFALQGIVITAMKHSIEAERPDKSAHNSFPSGHTATAFGSAHILHKEYGHLSPLYDILGYSMAITTGVYRQINNRHWFPDVLAGAGIGILISEFTYDMFHRWLGDKGRNKPFKVKRKFSNSNLSLRVAYAHRITDEFFDTPDSPIRFDDGFGISLAYEYELKKHWALVFEGELISYPLKLSDHQVNLTPSFDKSKTTPLASRGLYFGGKYRFYNKPLFLDIPFLIGFNNFRKTLIEVSPSKSDEKIPIYELESSTGISFKTGFQIGYQISKKYNIQLFGHFNFGNIDLDESYAKEINSNYELIKTVTQTRELNYQYIQTGIAFHMKLF